uniref:Uncharacterized protein n=2 Tax=Kalanchoe fedtschenkoi TaxID=63787 RepID=A0A7N0U3S8_KALFE
MKFEMEAEMEIRSSGSNPNLNSYGYPEDHHQQQQNQTQRRQHRKQYHQVESSSKWSHEENKMFENALAVYDKDSPDRWQKVAAMIPGKTVGDVVKQYEELEADVSSIEAGLVPVPGYTCPAFTLDWAGGSGGGWSQSGEGFSHGYGGVNGGKRLASVRGLEQERKKGVPWTEEEHKLFLLGLKKYGKGDWRNISRNFVITRTPTQVASHAQKYFIRQLSGGKDKRRASIHDITTVNLNESQTLSPDQLARGQHSPDMPFQWGNQASTGSGGSMDFNGAYGFNSGRSGMLDSYMGSQSLGAFQMQSAMHYPQVCFEHLFYLGKQVLSNSTLG